MTTLPLRVGSLFSGAAGLDQAFRLAYPDSETVWFCEYDPAPSAVLAHHYPDIPNLGDVTTVDWEEMKMASNRKLTPDQVESAVRMYRDAEMSLAQVATYFEVSRQAMWDLLRRRITLRPQKRYGADNHFYRGGPTADGRAHDVTERAIERGVLVRPDVCDECGGPGVQYKDGRASIQAHHCDYNKPLDVVWLCKGCHHEWHRTNTAIPVAGGDAKGSLAEIDVLLAGFP